MIRRATRRYFKNGFHVPGLSLLLLNLLFLANAQAQLIEKQKGFPFERPGFFAMPGTMSYDLERHRLAVSDKGRNTINILDLSDGSVNTLGEGTQLTNPFGLAFARNGDLYVSEEETPILLKFKFESDIIDTLDLSKIDSTHTIHPRRFCIDQKGIIYIADRDAHTIYLIDDKGQLLKKITDELRYPDGILAAPSGEIYVADKGADPILIFDKNGKYQGRLFRPEAATEKISFSATGLAVDQLGWIYTINSTGNKIVYQDPTGVDKTEWAPAMPPFFPIDIAIDRYDDIYILESGAGRILIVSRGDR